MRSIFILSSVLALCLSGNPISAQTLQNINKTSGTVSNPISEIDSIRFDAGTNQMVVVTNSGSESHAFIDVLNVTFGDLDISTSSCGAPNVHNQSLNYGTLTDQEGNSYKTILIGEQEWMAENLSTSIYLNGDPILHITSDSLWASTSLGAWCFLYNDITTECPEGKIYNWYAVNDNRKLCPIGWHIPTDNEWSLLLGYLDPSIINNPFETGPQSYIAGSLLKSTGAQYWAGTNAEVTNESGFSALSTGWRYGLGTNGSFTGMLVYTGFWSSTEYSFSDGYSWVCSGREKLDKLNTVNKSINFPYETRTQKIQQCL